jgi:hypothetical protein
MEMIFVINDQHKVDPDTEKDRRTWRKLRSARPGTRLKFQIFEDRSTPQCRMLFAIHQFMLFSNEELAKKYPTKEAAHNSFKWQFCEMRPEYYVIEKAKYNGEIVNAKVPFSYNLRDGVDSEGANEFTSWILSYYAGVLGITVEQLKQKSEEHRKYEA